MAWDHVSTFWNAGHRGGEGLLGNRPDFPDLTQFLLRFVTHWAAPTFIFLAGVSLAFSVSGRLARGQSQGQVTRHLLLRGLILWLISLTLEWPPFGLPFLYFGVIACIGVSLMLMSVLRFLPVWAILALSLAAILAHPFLSLDWIPNGAPDWLGHYLRVIVHEPDFSRPPFVGLYPIIPWLGVMGLGWCFGRLLINLASERMDALTLPLVGAGLGMLLVWLAVRWLNSYGNLLARQGDSLQDWLLMSKYPPDLAFLLWGLAGTSLFMALGVWLERRGWLSVGLPAAICDLGRVPLFIYIAHLWLYRVYPGWSSAPMWLPLPVVGAFWLLGLLILWELARLYVRLKRAHPASVLQFV